MVPWTKGSGMIKYMHFNPPYEIGDIIQTNNNVSPQFVKVAKGEFTVVENQIAEKPVKQGHGWRKIGSINE